MISRIAQKKVNRSWPQSSLWQILLRQTFAAIAKIDLKKKYSVIPASIGKSLQSVLNSAARLIHLTSRYEHVTPLLIQLHWLPIEQRITFKIAVITFKALHGAAPSYITDLIKPYTPGRLLRSSNQFLLSTSKFNLKTYGGRSFTIAAPSVWNALPFELRSCNSLSSFKSKLKTWLFKICYDVVV